MKGEVSRNREGLSLVVHDHVIVMTSRGISARTFQQAVCVGRTSIIKRLLYLKWTIAQFVAGIIRFSRTDYQHSRELLRVFVTDINPSIELAINRGHGLCMPV